MIKNFDESIIKDQLKIVASGADPIVENKIIDDTIITSNSDSKITKSSDAALNTEKLTNEEIQKIAESLFLIKQNSSASGSNSYRVSSDESDRDNSNGKSSTSKSDDILNNISNTSSESSEEKSNWINNRAQDVLDLISKVNGISGDKFSFDLTTLINTLDKKADSNKNGAVFFRTISQITQIISQNLQDYKDGVSETSFGAKMEDSWYSDSKSSFLTYFKNRNANYKINILNSTPLDSGSERDSIYGSLILGTPFLFNKNSDVDNRVMINTFVKDGKILSLTPGMPEYHGTSYDILGKSTSSLLNQTKEPSAMMSYLLKNGLDKDFSNKDKRYYTFKANYDLYFSYLETMLNVIWVKMGLAKNGESFNLFSFFNIKNSNSIDPTGRNELKSQYNSSIGFFTNVVGGLSESIDNSRSGFGSELASNANSLSDEYQRLNFIHGMGTGSALHSVANIAGRNITAVSNVGEFLSKTFINASRTWSNSDKSNLIKSGLALIKTAAAGVFDIGAASTTQDLGSLIQQFTTSNGMKLKYPDLWSDSDYSKNINFDLSFISPYGDPLSIFKYVYVPFCAILCFAMPRQAAENGYVSPFFVRADVPGLFTSDLAMISSLTWTKGGANRLFTKDGLPRAIDCSVSLMDLYPFLAMTKRLSYLSANPSYAVFLDNLSGMMSLNDNRTDDGLNSYFDNLINRVNGESEKGTNMWNKFNSTKSSVVKNISDNRRNSISGNTDPYSIPWFHNSSF